MVPISAPVNKKSAGIGMIGDRIKEERERLGFTQPQFAEAAGAAKRTLIEWEKGATSPTAVQLSALVSIGVDALYVLTGVRSGAAPVLAPEQLQAGFSVDVLSRDEQCLVENIRAVPEPGLRLIRLNRTVSEPSSASVWVMAKIAVAKVILPKLSGPMYFAI